MGGPAAPADARGSGEAEDVTVPPVDQVDVLVVGAGLSGIGAACHLRRECPTLSVVVVEGRDRLGGTWDLFRYPGVRSDSDMFTLAYDFRPWTQDRAIADGASILTYLTETAREYGIDQLIRYRHRVIGADFDRETARWTVRLHRGEDAEPIAMSCSFLFCCTGYYRYEQGYTPELPGRDSFSGPVVHPQHWPAGLDVSGRRVAVIGSGATAITLVPALAEQGARVTMVQRSPSWVATLPSREVLAARLRGRLPGRWIAASMRWKNILAGGFTYRLSRRHPKLLSWALRRATAKQLPVDFDTDTHFGPRYDPWDQRLCVAPDGDLFRAIRSGSAEVVTDVIARLTADGIELVGGGRVAADIIVTATGLSLLALGGMSLSVEGDPVQLADTIAYKGMMLSGVPNFALTIGYPNASWTLKSDLVARYVCLLLAHLQRTGNRTVTPVAPGVDDPSRLQPLIDLTSGYVRRGLADLPRQGIAPPWRIHQDYRRDRPMFRRDRLAEDVIFGR